MSTLALHLVDAAGVAQPTPEVRALNLFMLGAIVLAAGAIAAIFLRHWRKTRDGLLLMFAIAFALMAVMYAGQAVYTSERDRLALYALRLATYAAIIVGIVLKNRAPRRAGRSLPPT